MLDVTFEMIAVREWFDAHYGNTYSSAAAWVALSDRRRYIVIHPFYYGHGVEMAKDCIIKVLQEEGVFASDSIVNSAPWPVRADVCTVMRRKDLHFGGRNAARISQTN